MSLASLPPEVLSDVTSLISGVDIASLCMTGCKELSSCFTARGGVRKLQLALFRGYLPSLASRLLMLQELTVSSPPWQGIVAHQPANWLKQLPTGLQSLDLEYFGGAHDFQHFFASNRDYFPQLTSLTAKNDHDMDVPRLDFETLYHWPDTLTYLKLYTDIESLHLVFSVSSFPRNITHLSIAATTIIGAPLCTDKDETSNAAMFPSSLQHLHMALRDDQINWLRMLPPGIVTCEVIPSGDSPHMQHWSMETHFPKFQSLATLDIRLNEEALPLVPSLLKSLPESITHLCLVYNFSELENFETSILPHLPRNLRTQHNLLPDEIDSNWVPLLPRKMVSLEGQVPLESAKFLPPTLTNADFSLDPDSLDSDIDKWSLSLASYLPNLKYIVLPTLTEKLARLLPPSLEDVYLLGGNPDLECIQAIPRGVKRLQSDISRLISDEKVFPHLPPHLQVLRSEYSEYDTEKPQQRKVMVLSSPSASLLPRTLTVLKLGPVSLASAWFTNLPPTLRELRMEFVGKISDEALNFTEPLPKTLEIIALLFDQRALNREQLLSFFSVLPPRLVDLTLTAARFPIDAVPDYTPVKVPEVKDEDLAALPRHLQRLLLPRYVSFTKEAHNFLPMTLSWVGPPFLLALRKY